MNVTKMEWKKMTKQQSNTFNINRNSYIYLASPYSHPDEQIKLQRFEDICKISAYYFSQGYIMFVPIAQSHPIAEIGKLTDTDWEYWKEVDTVFLQQASSLWVVMLEGWKDSIGVQAEIKIAMDLGLPICYINPYPILQEFTKYE